MPLAVAGLMRLRRAPQARGLWGLGVAAKAPFWPCDSRLSVVPAAARAGSLLLGAASGRWLRSWFRRGALAAARASTAGMASGLGATRCFPQSAIPYRPYRLQDRRSGRIPAPGPGIADGLDHLDLGRPAGADHALHVLQPCPHPLPRHRRPPPANRSTTHHCRHSP